MSQSRSYKSSARGVEPRRKFLRRAGLAAACAAGVTSRSVFAAAPRSCVVIGAGLSGLAAAHKLKRAGWTVTVIEARNRIGGRVLSHRFGENPNLVCELGAEWVGASHERIIALCREFRIPLQDHRFRLSLSKNNVISRPGEWRFSEEAEQSFARFRDEYKSYKQIDRERLDRYDWWTWLERIGFTDDDLRLRDLMDSTDFGESIRHVSAYAAAAEYFESSPENEMDFRMTGGNSRLAEELAARVGRESLRLNTQVTSVTERRGRVAIRTSSGETFDADACICTVPATVLDRIAFDPPLPATQSAAAAQLQYARISKNSVLFDQRFWGAEDFSLVSDTTAHYYFHTTKNQPGTQGILCSYAIGEKADVLAAQDDRRRLEVVTRELTPLDARAPSLARAIASYHWQRDPHTQGAYALYRPGQWFGTRPVLQRPHGKIFFAGEHLADWQGFMEGAVVTGEEAVTKLLKG